MKYNHDGFNTIISLVILRMNKAEMTSELSDNICILTRDYFNLKTRRIWHLAHLNACEILSPLIFQSRGQKYCGLQGLILIKQDIL